MDQQLREKIKRIKLYTKRLAHSSLTGDYLSAFKGSGLEFDQIREYQPGDDIRSIDWNNTAKMNKIMVKQFIEERDRTVILAIDMSKSLTYSSKQELKQETLAHIAASLTFIAEHNKDKIGALFFSDRIEKWIPPNRSAAHVGVIVQNIFSLIPHGVSTNFQEALSFLMHLKQRNAIVFLISDWIDQNESYKRYLQVTACKFDLIALRIIDEVEVSFPRCGLIDLQDPETGESMVLDTNYHEHQTTINSYLSKRLNEQAVLLRRYKIDLLDIQVGHPFLNALARFFKNRTRKQIA